MNDRPLELCLRYGAAALVIFAGSALAGSPALAEKAQPPITIVLFPGVSKVSDSLEANILTIKEDLRANARLEVLTFSPDAPSFEVSASQSGVDINHVKGDADRGSMARALGAQLAVTLSQTKGQSAEVDVVVRATGSKNDPLPAGITQTGDSVGAAEQLIIEQAMIVDAARNLKEGAAAHAVSAPVAPLAPARPSAATPIPAAPIAGLPAQAAQPVARPPAGSTSNQLTSAPAPPATGPATAAPAMNVPVAVPIAPAPATPSRVTPQSVPPQQAPATRVQSPPEPPAAPPAVATTIPAPMPGPQPPATALGQTPSAATSSGATSVPAAAAPRAAAASSGAAATGSKPTSSVPLSGAVPVAEPAASATSSPAVVATTAPHVAMPPPGVSAVAPSALPATMGALTAPAANLPQSSLDDAALRWISLGDTALAQANANDAIDDYRHAVDESPLNAQPRIKLAQAYVTAGQNDAALDELKRAAAVEPKSDALLQYLKQLVDNSTLPGAEGVLFGLQATSTPDDPVALLKLGDSYWNAGRMDQAEQTYLRAVKAGNGAPQPYARLARLYAATEHYDECLNALSHSGEVGYPVALRIIVQRTDNLIGDTDAALQAFQAGQTRTEFYDAMKALDVRIAAYAAFITKVRPPAAFKVSYLHRRLAANLLSQMTPELENYALTGQNDFLAQAKDLERNAENELRDANVADNLQTAVLAGE